MNKIIINTKNYFIDNFCITFNNWKIVPSSWDSSVTWLIRNNNHDNWTV